MGRELLSPVALLLTFLTWISEAVPRILFPAVQVAQLILISSDLLTFLVCKAEPPLTLGTMARERVFVEKKTSRVRSTSIWQWSISRTGTAPTCSRSLGPSPTSGTLVKTVIRMDYG